MYLVRPFFIASGGMVYFRINNTKIEYLKMVYLEGLTLDECLIPTEVIVKGFFVIKMLVLGLCFNEGFFG